MYQRVFLAVLLVCGCRRPAPAAGQARSDDALRVPEGFKIAVFADKLEGVRYLTLGPGNVIYASQPGSGRIVRMRNRDGAADSIVEVASGLKGPFGIAFRGDTMYVAEVSRVKRFTPGARDSKTIIDDIPGGGHSTRTILFGPDGKLYLAVGSSCNLCNESKDDSLRAAVSQFNPDGSGGRVFARGLRNTVGIAFNPKTAELWGGNNDRDNLGDDVPPEHINIIKDGKNYGWPQCYLPGKPNPEYGSADCSNVEPPAITVQAHSAPLGLAFYTGAQFPPDYRGDAFVTLHGSWNRSIPTGAKVVRIHVDADGHRATGVEDFIVGWQRPDGTRWGRPVGLLVLPDGSLLVSDDYGGKIWRVTYGR